jgi:hypothetical protein
VKSELYLAFVPLVNAGRLELLHHARLRRQLLDLDRRVGPSGRDSVDHGPGGHDDVANVCAGACVLAGEHVPGGEHAILVAGERQMLPRQIGPYPA